jgi:hypothetical protein
VIWWQDSALAERPDGAFVDEAEAKLIPGAVPTVYEICSPGNTEMSRLHRLFEANEASVDLLAYVIALGGVVAIHEGAESITDRAALTLALEEEIPWDCRRDLAREILYIAEGGPPGARRFSGSVSQDAQGFDGESGGAELPEVPPVA